MATLLSIEGKTRPDEIRAGIVEKLEEWLADAREGKLKSLALCAIEIDNTSRTTICASDDMHALLGAIVHLQFDLIKSLDD
jgi:acetolactate synthase small subunit